MTVMPAGFNEALQFLGQPICRSIARSSRPSTLLSTDRCGGFLDGLLRSCAAGAPERIGFVSSRDFLGEPELASLDGLAFAAPDDALLPGRASPRTRRVASLDRQGLLLSHVTAVAIGAQAGAAKAWRGATELIARDRPIFVSYAQSDPDLLNDLLPFGYVVRPFAFWGAPQAAPLLVAAIPAEQQESDAKPTFLDWSEAAPVPSQAKLPVPRPLRTVVKPEALTGRGLHPAETTAGHSWVWTGPVAKADIRLPQTWFGPQAIRLTIYETLSRGGRDGLAFLVNGRPVQAEVMGPDLLIRTAIPAHEFSGEFTLTIVTPDPPIPAAGYRHLRTSLGPLEISWL